MPANARFAMVLCAGATTLCVTLAPARYAARPVQEVNTRALPQPSGRPPRAKASEADSLAAERRAWTAIRATASATGTRAARERRNNEARTAIVQALGVIPGSEWLNSMRLRYPTPGSPPASSPASRTLCGASPWWCDFLYLLPLHRARSYRAADSVLGAALAHMPEHVRCIWGDVAPLLADRKTRREYERMSCSERAAFEDRLWWLADPLHSTPGNERRVEHFAREINMRLVREASLTTPRSVPGLLWSLKVLRRATHIMHGSDLVTGDAAATAALLSAPSGSRRFEGFLDRADDAYGYGNPLAYRQSVYSLWEILDTTLRRAMIGRTPDSIPAQSHSFIPSVAAVRNPMLAEPSHWQLTENVWFERSFSPVGTITQLDHQHAFFRRGDSARLVVVTDISGSPLLRGTLSSAALARSRGPAEQPSISRLTGGPRYEFSPIAPYDSTLVSLEIVAMARGAGRTRFAAAPQPRGSGRIEVSDVILLAPADAGRDGAAILDSVIPRVLPTTRVNEGQRLGLFWEIYGLVAGERPAISVSALPEPGRSILGILPGQRGPGEARTTFTDIAAAGDSLEGRSIGLDISTLRAGRYLLVVAVEVSGAIRATTSRRIEIVRR